MAKSNQAYVCISVWFVLQERSKEELRKQQKAEFDSLASKLDSEAGRQEEALKNQLGTDREKTLREMKNRHAAEIAARPDLSQEQINMVGITMRISLKYITSIH